MEKKGRSYRDSFCAQKHGVNLRLAELHGRHLGIENHHGHAIYLDGSEMRTTEQLREYGWRSDLLHIPNCSNRDFKSMQVKIDHEQPLISTVRTPGYPSGTYRPNIYKKSSSTLLCELGRADWVHEFQFRHSRGPFSFVYFDYTDNRSRTADLHTLLTKGLMTRGILAVTCPARAPHVPDTDDKHIKDERSNVVDFGDGKDHKIAGDFSGLVKMQIEIQQACVKSAKRLAADPIECITYMGKKTIMWVAVYTIMCDDISNPFEFDIGFSGQCNGWDLQQYHPVAHAARQKVHDDVNAWNSAVGFSFVNPAADTGVKERGVLRDIRDIARKKFQNNDEASWPWQALLVLDWNNREEQREWDFLVAMYGREQANDVPCIHQDDRMAFTEYIGSYNMWTCEFEGDIETVWAKI